MRRQSRRLYGRGRSAAALVALVLLSACTSLPEQESRPARRIGEAVMEELKRLDEVAYVRFASVYRQFTDVSSFMDELNKLVLEGKARAKENKPSGE